MRALHHPDVTSVDLPTLLSALADPVRLSVVRQLADSGGIVCGEFEALTMVGMSTLSHHLRILRQAGVLRVVPNGSFRLHELRAEELHARFPGLLEALVKNLNAPTPA